MHTLDGVLDRSASADAAMRPSPDATFRLLVADDQPDVVAAIRLLASSHQIDVTGASSPGEAMDLLRERPFDAALIDLNYGKGETDGAQGLSLISQLQGIAPGLPLVAMTAWNSLSVAEQAMRRGARDVVEKPWDEPRLLMLIRTQVQLGQALRRIAELEAEVQTLKGGTAPANGSMKLFEVEGRLVRQAMEQHQGNVSRAAKTLGLSRSALYRRLERHKI
ncbi:MAG: response regulator [Vicinamibacterales bacterium]